MLFIAKIIPQYRRDILEKSKVEYIQLVDEVNEQKWLSSKKTVISWKRIITEKTIIVGDYNIQSSIIIIIRFLLFKKVFIASDWHPIQNQNPIKVLRKKFLESISNGFIQGSPAAKPFSNKTKIKGLLYMSSMISFTPDQIEKEIDFIYIGQFIDRKNISYTIQVFNELSKRDLKCVAIGFQGNENKNVLSEIQKSKFPVLRSVNWVEAQNYLRKSKFLFYPSKEDVWGLTTLEALNNYCLPLFTNETISMNFYSNKLEGLNNYKISGQLKEDLNLCLTLNYNTKYLKMITAEYRRIEDKLIRESIDSLQLLKSE